ncbi:MAG TPA: DUF2778 domain-containing protein [Nitrosospira sp.]|jgi:hypothetical protein|nr:DUF2778 domain-containing protein [Nitrosospira sp.]
MHQCTFELNGEPLSNFKVGSLSFPAFSGKSPWVNSRAGACMKDAGPIPPGEYYIFDRQSGGGLGALYDMARQRYGWFALHRVDEAIDDEAWCEKIKRGKFRLHPKGQLGISEGCIVIEKENDFTFMSTIIRRARPEQVKGSKLLAYGKVTVK